MRNAIITITAGLMLMTVTSGCASWTSSKPKNNNSMWSRMQFWKKPYQRPQKMAAIWTHDILTMTAKPPTRGFGGRIYFYNEKSQAIPVDGELIVHGYEESRTGRQVTSEKTEADKTFVFTAEQFTEHFSSSELGASYSVWIPWDAADGMQKEITLIPTFKGTDGSLVQGEPAKLVLPGRTIEEPARTSPFQQVSYEQSETPTNTGPLPNGMKTTTISRTSQIARPSKKSSQRGQMDAPATQPNLGYTTEVRYGNSPLTPSANQLTGSVGQPVSRALSLYPDQNPAMAANQTPAQYPIPSPVGTNVYTMPNTAYPNAPFPSTMPNSMQPGALPSTYPNQPVQYAPGFQAPGNQAPGTQAPGTQLPGMQGPSIQAPGMQTPGLHGYPIVPTSVPTQMSPGIAGFDPVKPQAVQSAFATQWQPLGQSSNPMIQQYQQSPVQPAGFSQSPTAVQVQEQLPVMQPVQSMNRY